MTPFEQGAKAYKEGKGLLDNPYWQSGFLAVTEDKTCPHYEGWKEGYLQSKANTLQQELKSKGKN